MGALPVLVFSAAIFLLISCVTCNLQVTQTARLINRPNAVKTKIRIGISSWREFSLKQQSFSFGQMHDDDFQIGTERNTFVYFGKENNCYSLEYPLLGQGTISYVNLVVKSQNGDCKATITDGGIGKDTITITYHTYSSQAVQYVTFIYGYGHRFKNAFLTCKNGTRVHYSSSRSSCGDGACSVSTCGNSICNTKGKHRLEQLD